LHKKQVHFAENLEQVYEYESINGLLLELESYKKDIQYEWEQVSSKVQEENKLFDNLNLNIDEELANNKLFKTAKVRLITDSDNERKKLQAEEISLNLLIQDWDDLSVKFQKVQNDKGKFSNESEAHRFQQELITNQQLIDQQLQNYADLLQTANQLLNQLDKDLPTMKSEFNPELKLHENFKTLLLECSTHNNKVEEEVKKFRLKVYKKKKKIEPEFDMFFKKVDDQLKTISNDNENEKIQEPDESNLEYGAQLEDKLQELRKRLRIAEKKRTILFKTKTDLLMYTENILAPESLATIKNTLLQEITLQKQIDHIHNKLKDMMVAFENLLVLFKASSK